MSVFSGRRPKETRREDIARDSSEAIQSITEHTESLLHSHAKIQQANMSMAAYVNESRKMIAKLKISVAMTKRTPAEVCEVLQ